MPASSPARIGVVCEAPWDRKQLQACWPSWGERVAVKYLNPSAGELHRFDTHESLEPERYLDDLVATERSELQGVMSTSGGAGALVAAAAAERLGLAGPRPEAVFRLLDRARARQLEREVVPEAVPMSALISLDSSLTLSSLEYPCVVRPRLAAGHWRGQWVSSETELRNWIEQPDARDFQDRVWPRLNRLVGACTGGGDLGSLCWLAELKAMGSRVIVEGFVCEDRIEFFGILDVRLQPETGWVARYEYPSRMPPHVQSRILDIARRVVRHSGLTQTVFHLEVTWDEERDRVLIDELLPHLVGQTADLYHKVDGGHAYVAALTLCLQGRPSLVQRQGRYGCAASVSLYSPRPCRIIRVPDARDFAAAENWYVGTLVWTERAPGEILRAHEPDTSRYAVLNLGARDSRSLDARVRTLEGQLGFEFKPL